MWISALAWSSPQTAGKCLLHCGLVNGLQVNLCSSSCSTSLLPSSLSDLGDHAVVSHSFRGVCLFGFFVHLFFLLFCFSRIFPFLKYVFSEAPPAFLMGSAVPWGGSMGTVWKQLYPTWDSPGLPSQTPPCQDSAMDIQYLSKVLEIELPQLFKDFGINLDPTEYSMHHFHHLI